MRRTYDPSVHSSLLLRVRAELVHPERRELDQRHRLTRQREVRQLACPQPALREREDDVPHARPELRVRHERREPYCNGPRVATLEPPYVPFT
jgi:hypothetical protein